MFSEKEEIIKSTVARQDDILATIQGRGPDKSSIVEGHNSVVIHTLLSMTGQFREQPVIDERFLLLYNGEIYNDFEQYHAGYGDSDYLVSRLQEEGQEALRTLDGEFALCLHLFESQTLLLATDPFGTKPLYYQLTPSSCVVGSYESTIKASGQLGTIRQVPSNTLLTISLKDFSILDQTIIRPFDFHAPKTTTFDQWNEAFGHALRKRTFTRRHQAFVSFSSGHDSGLIAAELMTRQIDFHAYTVPYLEDSLVLDKRLKHLHENKIIYDVVAPTSDEIEAMSQFVWDHCDPFQLINHDSDFQNFCNPDMRILSGYIASAIIHQKARETGRFISLSGQGADEIYADYYNPHANPAMSELRGNWDRIDGPWKNFRGGWNRVFLGAGERIAGLFGIETRYPFLDFAVVQEFLNLDPRLKSRFYKAPITNRLRELDYPFHERKLGFAGFDQSQMDRGSSKMKDPPVLVATA